MAETPYTQPRKPNVIKDHRESAYSNPRSAWFRFTFVFGFLSSRLLAVMREHTDSRIQFTCFLGLLVLGGIWLKYIGTNPRKAERLWTKINFGIEERTGNHVKNKLTAGVSFLSTVYPLRKIHAKGLLEFTGNEFAVVIALNPKRITEDEREGHSLVMKGLVDGLHAGRIFKIHAVSKVNPRKVIIEYIMKVANKAGSKERAEHLNGILQKVMGDKTHIMMYRYYAFVGLGKHDTVQSAEIARGAVLDGLLLNMKRANLKPRQMEDAKEIKKFYREISSERAIL